MKFDNERPIYVQIVELVKNDIISGIYKPNDKMPVVRELAATYNVNPNTVQRAFMELEHLGFVKAERTTGRYVTDDNKLISLAKKDLINIKVTEFIEYMHNIGIENDEIINIIKGKKGTK